MSAILLYEYCKTVVLSRHDTVAYHLVRDWACAFRNSPLGKLSQAVAPFGHSRTMLLPPFLSYSIRNYEVNVAVGIYASDLNPTVTVLEAGADLNLVNLRFLTPRLSSSHGTGDRRFPYGSI